MSPLDIDSVPSVLRKSALGARALLMVAEPLQPGEDPEPLASYLWTLMKHGKGVGLAANQMTQL